jgi:hypothetical protein
VKRLGLKIAPKNFAGGWRKKIEEKKTLKWA